nr:hypothetical protein [Tanacetum cinerariifolium]
MCVFATKWKDIVIKISKWKSKRSVWGTIRKLCFAATVYYLWVNWKMVKRSYRDGWAIVIVDDASYRWLHWCFVRKGAAKIANVGLYMGKCSLLAVVTSIQCMVKPFMDAGLVGLK